MKPPARFPLDVPGKDGGLSVLGDTPFVAETPEELLDDATTPIAKFFIRNNGLLPEPAHDPEGWFFTVDGEVERPLRLSVAELKSRFAHKTYRRVLECGGNGRSFFEPPAQGNPWTNGGIGCAEWTGVSLRDVLLEAGLKPCGLHTAHYGADPTVKGETDRPAISRGMRIEKALEEHTLLAWGMNGEPLPFAHGGPLRLVVPGWPGSLSQKWLTRIWIRDREHDGPGMTGHSYRVPAVPIPPGSDPGAVPFRVLEAMPVRSIVSFPACGARFPAGTRTVPVRGAAWAGDNRVASVEVSADGGVAWTPARLHPTRNRYDWVRFEAELAVPFDGAFHLVARATDDAGQTQPLAPRNWNPQGYGCYAAHRVKIRIG